MCNQRLHWTDSESLEDTKEFEQSKETPPLPEPSPMLPEPTVPQETSPFTVAYTGAARTCEVKGIVLWCRHPQQPCVQNPQIALAFVPSIQRIGVPR